MNDKHSYAINLSVWCPVERIVANLIKLGEEFEMDRVDVSFDNFLNNRVFSAPIDGKRYDFNLGLSNAQRADFLSMPLIKGSVDFIDEDGHATPRQILIKHELKTDASPKQYVEIDGQRIVNGFDVSGNRVCFPEALFTTGVETKYTANPGANALVGGFSRPYFDYFILSRGTTITIVGPDCSEKAFCTGKIVKGRFTFNTISSLMVDDADSGQECDEVSFVDNGSTKSVSVQFLIDGVRYDYKFGQIVTTYDGRTIRCNDILDILKTISFVEICKVKGIPVQCDLYDPVQNVLTITFKKVGNQYIPDESFTCFVLSAIIDNTNINTIYENFEASENVIAIRDPKGVSCRLIGRSNIQSCHALSLAYMMISDAQEHLVTELIQALNALVQQGLLVHDGEGHLCGVTGKSANTGAIMTLRRELLTRDSTIKFERKQVVGTLSGLSDGYVLAGLDLSGDPTIDHYIVARKVGDQLYMEFDPWWKTSKPYDSNITEYVKGNNIFIVFEGRAGDVALFDYGFAGAANV